MSLCITIPVFNEERRLEKGVEALRTFLNESKLKARIDISDNGSTDRTVEMAQRLAARYADVTVTQVRERGVGAALQASWGAANEDVVGYVDVDLSTDVKHLLDVVRIFGHQPETDIVTGSRLITGARVSRRTFRRAVTSRAFNFLLRTLLGVTASDGMCGFKFLKRSRYHELRQNGLVSKDWFFNAELLIRGEWLGFKIVEIPVDWTDDPDSKVRIAALSISYLKSMFRLRRQKSEVYG